TECGATAPIARAYKITTTAGSCGGGVVTQVDADATTAGLQATATVPLNGSMRASLVAKMKLENVTTVASNNPFRCTFDVSVTALDTAPDRRERHGSRAIMPSGAKPVSEGNLVSEGAPAPDRRLPGARRRPRATRSPASPDSRRCSSHTSSAACRSDESRPAPGEWE